MPFLEEKDRKIIPRWRESWITIAKGELDSIGHLPNIEKASKDFITKKIRDWEQHRTLSFAADLIGSAFVLGYNEDATNAARFILSQGSGSTDANRIIAQKILNPEYTSEEPSPREPNRRIHLLKKWLRDDPRNCFTLADLALEYATLGQSEKAEHTVKMAIALAPSNRFILRIAARFHIHQEDL